MFGPVRASNDTIGLPGKGRRDGDAKDGRRGKSVLARARMEVGEAGGEDERKVISSGRKRTKTGAVSPLLTT